MANWKTANQTSPKDVLRMQDKTFNSTNTSGEPWVRRLLSTWSSPVCRFELLSSLRSEVGAWCWLALGRFVPDL